MAKLQPRDLLENQGEFGSIEKANFREDFRTRDLGLFLHVERQHAIAIQANNWLKRRSRGREARMEREEELAEHIGTSTVLLRRKLRGEITMTARDFVLLAHHTGHRLELRRVS
jgi:hypothetical protein